MKVTYFDKQLKKGEKDINFGDKTPSINLILQNLRVSLFNSRKARAVTKTKAEVRGGGKKPWRQKGTGRARTGSIRNPHWVGGGVSHGPRNINWSLSMSKNMAKRAFKDLFKVKAEQEQLNIVNFDSFTAPKSKDLRILLKSVLETNADKSITIIVNKEESLVKSASNFANIKTFDINSLSIKDVASSENVIISEKALSNLEERLK